MRKIIILGAGAIGSLVGALLSEKHDVTLIGRKAHITKINLDGLKITGALNKTFRVKSAEKIDDIRENSIIILTTKVQDSEKALLSIRDKVKKRSTLICLQNGLGAEKIAKDIVRCKVYRAITSTGAIFAGSGHIKASALHPVYIQKEGKELESIFAGCPIRLIATENIRQKIWEKLAINCVINALGSILKVENNKLSNPTLKEIKYNLFSECKKVAESEGVLISEGHFNEINRIISSSKNINSTLQDLIRKKKTEIDYINGALVNISRKNKVLTPVNEILYSLIKFLENF